MEKINILRSVISQPNETSFEHAKKRLTLRVLVVSSLVIFIIETFLMFTLEAYLNAQPLNTRAILDGLMLVTILLPINYIFIVRPMSKQIEEHHRTNLELRKSIEILDRFFSISDILIAYLDPKFNFIRVNTAYSATDQRPPEEFVGKNHFDLFPDADNYRIFTKVVQTGQPYIALEKPFSYAEHPERGVTYWDWSLQPVKDPDGSVSALILVLSNVTSRKMAQLALVASELRFRAAFNQTFQHSVLIDTNGKVLLANQTVLDFSRLSQDDFIGKPLWDLPWWNFVPPATYLGTIDQIKKAIDVAKVGTIFRGEQRIQSSAGKLAIMDITIKPVLNDQGEPFLLIYEACDITMHKNAQEALIRSESRTKQLYLAETRAREFAETLRSAVLALSRSLNMENVLEALLDHLNRFISYTSAHVFLLEDEDHLVIRLERGAENWEDGQLLLGRRFEVNELPYIKPLLEQRELINVWDTLLNPGVVFTPEGRQVLSWLGIPLLAGEQVIGACVLEHKCPGFFNEDLIQWANALTSQAAVAIQNAWLFEQVRDGREHLQALSRRLVEVQENERHYIARELHDEAGQALASLMIGLRHLELESHNPVAVETRSNELKEIADGVLENLHRLAIDLRPAALDHLGLVAALRQHAERFSDETGLTVQFEVIGKVERMIGEVETTVYRIIQEALTNVVRHARATRVDLLIERRGSYLVVIVEDNGIGFDPQSPIGPSHLGMLGMNERANMLGGKITYESAPGKGATMLLEVPCQFES